MIISPHPCRRRSRSEDLVADFLPANLGAPAGRAVTPCWHGKAANRCHRLSSGILDFFTGRWLVQRFLAGWEIGLSPPPCPMPIHQVDLGPRRVSKRRMGYSNLSWTIYWASAYFYSKDPILDFSTQPLLFFPFVLVNGLGRSCRSLGFLQLAHETARF